MLTTDMKRIIREQRLGFVATVNADGTPNLSPKATFVVLDDTTIAFGDLRSPGTLRNTKARPAVEVNFVDPFVRKGYRFAGTAQIIERDAPAFAELALQFAGYGDLASRLRAIVRIKLSKALALTSPAYDLGAEEAELRRMWTARFRKLQPNQRFEE
jgi:predicted pyridoxine 5'-phosphate oxidase superfamily flavin-nucleotide-binding protein